MLRVGLVMVLATVLLVPTSAFSQTSKIILLDTFGDYKKGEQFFIFGQVLQTDPDSYVVTQIVNPNGDLCQIQQLMPLSGGDFITDPVPLSGAICGLDGKYQVKVFYGENSQTSSFQVLNENVLKKGDAAYLDAATELLNAKVSSLKGTVSDSQVSSYQDEVDRAKSDGDLTLLMSVYSELLSTHFAESDLFGMDAKFRPAIQTAFDNTKNLVSKNMLDASDAKKIDDLTYDAVFFAQIGNDKAAIDSLRDVYSQIENADPQKAQEQQPLTYSQISDLLKNVMTKSNSVLSGQVKEELGFIFSRGTGPLYADKLQDLLDVMTEARMLDAVLNRDDNLTTLIKTKWEPLRESLLAKESLDSLLEQKEKVDNLYDAAVLLKNLEKVDRFTSQDPKSELAVLIQPRLDDLLLNLQTASSPDDIISQEQDIMDMKNVIDISSRISTTIDFAKNNGADPKLVDSFELMLGKLKDASSVSEMLAVVTEFDNTINDLRENRSPLTVLTFQYEQLKSKAELQADYDSLNTINTALQVINAAVEMEKGNPSVNRIDKIEVLLSWAGQNEPIIRTKLDSYSEDAYKIRAADILQRAQSLENLLDLGDTRNRFLPGYTNFTDSMRDKLETARNLVIKNDLDGADSQVRQLFVEWQQVSNKYSEDPFGSENGYTADEIKRIEYKERIDNLSNFATTFYNSDFESHASEFASLKSDAYDLIDYGNFVDADKKISEIRSYLSNNLEMHNNQIIFDISYSPEREIWVMSGAVDKSEADIREPLYLTVYDMNGDKHSSLQFSDTKQGDFFTQWHAPTEPGLYVVMLQWQNSQASQIVDVQDKTNPSYTREDLQNVDYARDFEELETFINTFGGANYEANKAVFDPIMSQAKNALHNKDFSTSSAKIKELKQLMERYLPSRARTAVIDAHVQDGKLYLSGAIQKTVAFSEDIFIDVFNQKGERVDEVSLKDSASGYFNKVIDKRYEPGIYVAQLQYHDLLVSDFFTVG